MVIEPAKPQAPVKRRVLHASGFRVVGGPSTTQQADERLPVPRPSADRAGLAKVPRPSAPKMVKPPPEPAHNTKNGQASTAAPRWKKPRKNTKNCAVSDAHVLAIYLA